MCHEITFIFWLFYNYQKIKVILWSKKKSISDIYVQILYFLKNQIVMSNTRFNTVAEGILKFATFSTL